MHRMEREAVYFLRLRTRPAYAKRYPYVSPDSIVEMGFVFQSVSIMVHRCQTWLRENEFEYEPEVVSDDAI